MKSLPAVHHSSLPQLIGQSGRCGRFFVFEKEFLKEGLVGREDGKAFSRRDAEAQREKG